MIGFERSAWLRLAAGAAFCLGAVALVWAVEGGVVAAPPPLAPAAAVPAARTLRLEVASTFPVARWRVSVLGAEQAAEAAEPFAWRGRVAVPPGEEVLVQAAAAAGAPANRALRLRLGDAPERLAWGSGDLAVAEVAP